MSDTTPAPAPKKKHRFLKFFGGLIAVIVVVSIFTSGGDDSTTTTESGAPSEADEAVPGLGDEAVDGKFTFVVDSVEDGPDTIGDDMLGVTAQGRFVLVEMTVTNHGDEAQSFFADNQYLIDTEGREASADSEASLYLDQGDTLFSEINPGNSLTGTVVFDIPADAQVAELDLHDSAFSGGVTVEVAR